jgi:hypothetical protein
MRAGRCSRTGEPCDLHARVWRVRPRAQTSTRDSARNARMLEPSVRCLQEIRFGIEAGSSVNSRSSGCVMTRDALKLSASGAHHKNIPDGLFIQQDRRGRAIALFEFFGPTERTRVHRGRSRRGVHLAAPGEHRARFNVQRGRANITDQTTRFGNRDLAFGDHVGFD